MSKTAVKEIGIKDELVEYLRNPLKEIRIKDELDNYINGFLKYSITRVSSIKRYNTRKFISPQSVLEHLAGVTLISMVISDYFNQQGIKNNAERVLRMAITHDLDEVVSGDIPHDVKYKYGKESEKLRKALSFITDRTIKSMYEQLGDKKLIDSYISLYMEEKEKQTLEAKIVKLADFIDVMIYSTTELSLGNTTIIPEKENSTERYQELLHSVLSEVFSK